MMQDQNCLLVLNFNPYMTNGLFSPYQLNETISKIRGCLVHFSTLILFFIEFPVSKQCRPWSVAAFCGVWSESALFV